MPRSLPILLCCLPLPLVLLTGCPGDVVMKDVNTAPIVSIDSPGSDAPVLALGETFTFAGVVNDAQQTPESLTVSWTSSIDGLLDDTPADVEGRVGFSTNTLSVGSHVIELAAQDDAGEITRAQADLVVERSNAAPSITIDWPVTGESFDLGSTINFSGTATDPDAEDPATSLAVSWSSDVNGALCNDAPLASGIVSCTATGLSLGTHIITASVADAMGLTAADQVVINVRAAPVVSIEKPASGDITLETGVTFLGEVSDETDRADTLSIRWESSLDGTFNWDPADASGFLAFTATTLSRGRHVVTLTATDAQGAEGSDAVEFDVVGPDDWDADGDGWSPNAGDCDDADSSVSPGVPEACNTVDDDCDGEINEGFGDGYEPDDDYADAVDLGAMDGDGYCIYYVGYISGSADVQTLSGTIHNADDVDWYVFSTEDVWYDCFDQEGYGIQVTLSNIPAGHDYALDLYWMDGGGTVVAASNKAGSATEEVGYNGTYSLSSDSDDGGEFAIAVTPTATSSYGCSGSYELEVAVW